MRFFLQINQDYFIELVVNLKGSFESLMFFVGINQPISALGPDDLSSLADNLDLKQVPF
jgi:hypothetical protein